MFSLNLARDLVYGALALSSACALATIVAVIWGTARARRRRWPWALAAQVVACAPAAWIWLYPSFAIGAVAGGELGAQVGHHLSPTADATLMAMGIGLGTYVVFTAPMAVLVLLVGLAVTSTQTVRLERLVVAGTGICLASLRGFWAARRRSPVAGVAGRRIRLAG